MAHAKKKEEPMLSIEEVGEHLNVGPQTITKWIRSGDLKAFQFSPKLYRVNRSDLDAFVESRTVSAAKQ